MRAVSTVIALSAALASVSISPAAQALGFGRVNNATQLGQALNFSAAVRLDANESLVRECVSAEVMSGENRLQPGQLRVTLENTSEPAERNVRITSSALIDEPVLTVTVTLGCGAKVTRRFVSFIDPPGSNLAVTTAAVDASMQAPQRVDSQVAPLLAIVQAGAGEGRAAPAPSATASTRQKAKSDSSAATRRTTPAASRRVAARKDAGSSRRAAAPARAAVVARLAPGASRLQLEAAPTVVARAAAAASETPAAASPTLPSAPTAADDQAVLLEREHQRILVLEDGLTRLRSDSQATQAALAGLQARLKEAERERYANSLVYALAWLCGLLALAVAGLLWRQSRQRSTAAQWWAAPAAAAPAADPSVDSQLSAPALLHNPVTVANAFEVATAADFDRSGSGGLTLPRPAAPPATVAAAAPAARELSVEELIDLEQQAEFFVVLGQDEAAIELLMSHVRSDGGTSPLPYLKLLEIYRRRGENDAYERIRERFNRRFNAYAPEWDADLQQGRSLEDYPDIVARLNTLWLTPARAMETLDASLFRRHKSDHTFDLPAYRELLFLYSIARDLAEHGACEPPADVDLLLPLGEGDAATPATSRLRAAAGESNDFENSHMVTLPTDLDVSFGPAPDPYDDGTETAPSALRRTPEHRFGNESAFVDFDLSEPAPLPAEAGKTGSSSGR